METEAKFVIPDGDTFARLNEVERFGPYVRKEPRTKQVHDRYLDTAGRRFYEQQFYARLREGKNDGSMLLTLKRLGAAPEGAVHVREEYQTEVPGLDVQAWPEGEVRTLVEEIAGEETLSDLFSLDQTREVSVLYDHERAVAEMSLDEVMLEGPDEPTRIYELEVELLPDGTIADLAMISRQLTDDYGLHPQRLSKFERAMRMLAVRGENHEPAHPTVLLDGTTEEPILTVPPPDGEPDQAPDTSAKKRKAGVEPTDSMAAAARKVLKVQLEAMLDNEEGSRLGEDPEAVHDMRVATRRMRAAMRVMGDYLGGKAADRIRKDARSVARALGAVRDLDVLIGYALEFQRGLPDDQQAGMEGLLAEWQGRREKARKQLLRLLDSDDYRRFTRRMETFVNEEAQPPDQSAGAVPYQVRHVAGGAIWTHYEEVRAFETVMDQPEVEQLHALRITGKYLRYTLEFFSEVLPQEAKALIKDVVGMQDELGAMHDADVAAGLIHDYLDTPAKGKKKERQEPPAGLLAYLAEREATRESIRAGFHTTWDGINSPKWRQRLAAMMAGL